MSTETRTTCPYCGVGCGVLARPGAPVAGDPAHPANFGRLCSKGSALAETLSLDGRLLHPEIGNIRVTWDQALTAVANGFARTIAEHGPDSVALYVSGQLLTEDYYAANKLAKGFLGTANIDSNSRLCMASAVAGHRRAFGEDVVPGIYEDLELADLVVLVGSNTAWCHPVLYQRILAAREQRPEMRIAVIDPRRTATCEGADLHLPLAPGTDVALFTGLLAHLADNQALNDAYVANATTGAEDAIGTARAQTPNAAATAALCGLDTGMVEQFFAWFTDTERAVTVFSQGVNQSSAGTDKVNAILNVHLATGRIGRPGMGPFSVTGQPNAMGGREVGALANTLAAHLEWDRPGDADLLRHYWSAPNLARSPGLKAVELFQAIGSGKIKAVWIIATNPVVSLPEAETIRRALRDCPLVVVSDCMREADTADYAHIRLPALAWGEKDGTVTNSERSISRQRAFLPVPGEARPDWWIIAEVAGRLGYADAFRWNGPADIFREHAGLSGLANGGSRVFDISALATLTDAEYAALAPTRWPCPASGPAPARLFGTGGFPTPDGRARLVATAYRAPAGATDAAWPLVLLTGRVRDQWHTMTRSGKAPRLLAHTPEPFLAVHPDDAAGIADGALAVIEAVTGCAVLRLRHDPGLRRGNVFAPMHWTARFAPSGRINPAVNAAVDPISGQPELKHTPVRLAPFPAAWHGFLIARRNLGTGLADWTAVLPATETVWRHELAGTDAPQAAFARLRGLFGDAAWMQLSDPARGVFRAALLIDGRLEACLFIGPDHALPARDWLVGQFATESLASAERRTLLAARPAAGSLPEAPVCVCHAVGAAAIRRAIAAGAASVERDWPGHKGRHELRLLPAGDSCFAAGSPTARDRLMHSGKLPAGIVHLVGAGPGAADLLTLRAVRLLERADAIVHDRLVSDEVLALANPAAERIYVGKRRADHCLPQAEINALLVRLAHSHACVVRLKGGDPFIFGRGGEEAEALAQAGIETQIVPGVTAALACAAQAGIPLTHRGVSRSVTFVTGHTKDGRLEVDFAGLARSLSIPGGSTLAVYMGIATLPALAAGLAAQGLDLAIPAALIERGGSPRQRELRGSLGELVRQGQAWSDGGPALLIIGEVAGALAAPPPCAAEASNAAV